ncbi:MFS transporter [Micrococcus terreus]|uniref:MFS transporter n=1 Tax=Micrococcus terreus TaxID=574650 RepID=UPI0021A8D7A0|nr:MFS transporter [Micrococcus terreus]MCT2088755.1 MFS transporter [Micrococcus terreus]
MQNSRTEWAGHEPGQGGYRRLLWALFLAGVATFSQLYSPQGLLPLISGDLGISASSAALSISAATLGLALGVIPWSYAGDRWGRLRSMGWAVLIACLCSLAATLAPQFDLLLALRFLEGAALGGVPALAIAYLSEEVHARWSAVAAGTYIAGTTLGGLAGRLVAAPIGELTHWRIGMLSVTLMAVACAVGFLLLAPPSRRFTPGRSSFSEAISALTGNLRSPRLLALYAQGMLLMGGFVAMYNFLGFHLTEEPFLLPLSVISLVFVAYLAGTWSSPVAGRLAVRHGRGTVLLASIALMIIGVLITLLPHLVAILAGTVLFTGAFFGAHSVASGWAGTAARAGRAQSSSLYNLGYYGGSSLFGWLGGVFLAEHGWTGTVLMTVGLAVIAGVLALVLLRGTGMEQPSRTPDRSA